MYRFIRFKRGVTPCEVVESIENKFKECKGYCYYKDGELHSKDEGLFKFHFDAIHNVVSVFSHGGAVGVNY